MSLSDALIEYASPTLAGIKVGSLFCMVPEDMPAFWLEVSSLAGSLEQKGLQLLVLSSPRKGRYLCYLYRPRDLSQLLARGDVLAFLIAQGYDTRTPAHILSALLDRLSHQQQFPHEVGLFLGYPLEDVEAFIRNQGHNCVCVGCWKVYGDADKAQLQFERCRRCTDIYRALYLHGETVNNLAVAA